MIALLAKGVHNIIRNVFNYKEKLDFVVVNT